MGSLMGESLSMCFHLPPRRYYHGGVGNGSIRSPGRAEVMRLWKTPKRGCNWDHY